MKLVVCLALLATACGPPKGFVAADDPMRPPPTPAPAATEPADCPPQEPDQGLPAKIYADRIIALGDSLARQGLQLLLQSEERSRGAADNQAKLAAAVAKFNEALHADPYNVPATYNLAAAYARIGRKQCALNLLARLVEMAAFPSQKEDIDASADRLLGRRRWQGKPDPDFEDLRTDQRFLDLAKNL